MRTKLEVGMAVAYCGIGNINKGRTGVVKSLGTYGVMAVVILDDGRRLGVNRHTHVWEEVKEEVEKGDPYAHLTFVKVTNPDFVPAVGTIVRGAFSGEYKRVVRSSSGWMSVEYVGSGSVTYCGNSDGHLFGFVSPPACAFLEGSPEYNEAVALQAKKPDIDKRKFILWNPKYPTTPSKILEGMAQAKAVASKMAAGNQGATFYICELVASAKTKKVTTLSVTVEDL